MIDLYTAALCTNWRKPVARLAAPIPARIWAARPMALAAVLLALLAAFAPLSQPDRTGHAAGGEGTR